MGSVAFVEKKYPQYNMQGSREWTIVDVDEHRKTKRRVIGKVESDVFPCRASVEINNDKDAIRITEAMFEHVKTILNEFEKEGESFLVRAEFEKKFRKELEENLKALNRGERLKERELPWPFRGLAAMGLGSFSMVGCRMTGKPAQMLSVLNLELCAECLKRCPHCIQKNRNPKVIAPDSAVRRFINTFGHCSDGRRFVSFAGAEPTQDINRLAKLAGQAHEHSETVLMTHAELLDEAAQVKLAGKIDYVDASLDGFRGLAKSAFFPSGEESPAWKNIQLAARSGRFKKVAVIVTVMKSNMSQLNEFLDFLAETFLHDSNQAISIGFCAGDEKDTLTQDDFNAVFATIVSKKYPLIAVMAWQYEEYLASVLAEFAGKVSSIDDIETGIRYRQIESVKFIVGSDIPTVMVRVDADGRAFYGCDHFLAENEEELAPQCVGNIIDLSATDLFK
ncbi:MAG: hypothetical protein V1763_00055 [Parcubacteria group bacterium]